MKVDSTAMNDSTAAIGHVDTAPTASSTTQSAAVRSVTEPANSAPERVGPTDTVTVSDTASRLSVAIRDARPPAGVDPSTLASLRDSVRTGSLALDIVSLANDILCEEGRP